MQLRYIFAHLVIAVIITCTTFVLPANAAPADYLTGFVAWRASENRFAAWQRDGVSLAPDGTLRLDPNGAHPGSDPYKAGSYYGINFYNGGTFIVGEAVSPIMVAGFAFVEAIASWNATTPAGTWIETQIRVKTGDHWSKWYNLGVWASDTSTIRRHSVKAQADADGDVAVDTLQVKSAAANAYQLKVRLFSSQSSITPQVRNVALTTSTTPHKPATLQPGNPALWNRSLTVPQCSQMVYADGGEVWCSPTSTSMVLGYWDHDSGPCEPRVRAAVSGVYDAIFGEHGNWPFNTAYASTHNLEAFVMRFSSLAQTEEWIAAGIPVILSLAWKPGELTGAPVSSAIGGHLVVLVGFDASGNPIINDPAASSNGGVRRVYRRSEFDSLWLGSSGGTAYLIYPPGKQVIQQPVAARFSGFYYQYDGLRLLGNAISAESIVNGYPAQYFEKGRIEDHQGESSDPNWRFMYGLLVDELQQAKANLPIGGDTSTLNYAALNALADPSKRVAPPSGYPGNGAWTYSNDGTTFIPFTADLRGASGHTVPGYFWSYLNRKDLFPGGWLHDTGLPISEVQQATVTKNFPGGAVKRTIYIQAFQRTILTYDPANPADWQVERANTGTDYRTAFPDRVNP